MTHYSDMLHWAEAVLDKMYEYRPFLLECILCEANQNSCSQRNENTPHATVKARWFHFLFTSTLFTDVHF